MILIRCNPSERPEGFLLVAQDVVTYELLGFAPVGEAVDYVEVLNTFQNEGRYKPRTGVLPATEIELRTEYFTIYRDARLPQLKVVRDELKVAPLKVTFGTDTYTFDLDFDAQININNTIESFEAIRLKAVELGHVDDGTIPWITATNVQINVTLAQLQQVKEEASTRALVAHLEYNAAKVALESNIPEEG